MRPAGVVYPARVRGLPIAHLATAEPVADGPPVLRAVCPVGQRMLAELELVPEADRDRLVWCGDCARYRDYLNGLWRRRAGNGQVVGGPG